jgi:hypothetical protein
MDATTTLTAAATGYKGNVSIDIDFRKEFPLYE